MMYLMWIRVMTLLTKAQGLLKNLSSYSSNPNLGNKHSSIGTSPGTSIDAQLMSYAGTQTYLRGNHLTCRVSTLASYASRWPYALKLNQFHKRRGRWEKSGTRQSKTRWISYSRPNLSEKSGILPGQPTQSWSKKPMENGECAVTTPTSTKHAPRTHTLCPSRWHARFPSTKFPGWIFWIQSNQNACPR